MCGCVCVRVCGLCCLSFRTQKELPIRISKRLQELQSLPVPMYSTQSVRELANLYKESFFQVLNRATAGSHCMNGTPPPAETPLL